MYRVREEDRPLVQVDVHLSPRFMQENMDETA